MKKNRIVGDVEDQGELICELPGCGEYGFAETEDTCEEALDHANFNSEVSHACSGLKSKSTFQGMVGHSSALLHVLELALRAARTNCTILVQGDTGTGKELLARGIHANSNRASKAFVTLNCGAIPRELFESELFGHVQGSFTGAVRNRTGRAEAANTGTLFLDEIGEMPLDLQVKLLRLIQGGEIERVGSAMPTKLDVRIIAATNRNLPFLVKKRKFREDLYHRLNVITLQLPNLRDRAEDIPELVQYFFRKSCAKHQRDDLRLSLPVLNRFAEYPWPGNIRELENAIERIVVLTPGREVGLNDLPLDFQSEATPLERIGLILPSKGVSLSEIEKELFREALKRNNWNRSRAARYLGVTRDTLNYRMRKFGLDRVRAGRLALGGVEKSLGTALVH
jgi:two-component system NtrC family response regulator